MITNSVPTATIGGVDVTNVRLPAWEARRAGGPAFDLSEAKLWRPRARPGSIRRSSLIEQLRRNASRPIVSVVAPAGYGKTTLLAQWAERNGQAFAWVSVDEADNDPKVLLTYVAEALNTVERSARECSTRWPRRQVRCPVRWCRGWDRRSPR